MAVAYQQQRPPHPVSFDVAYPERLSRVLIFFKLLLAIPQFIIVYLLQLVLTLLTFLAWFAILLTGRYPKAFFEFTSGVLRWQTNVFAYVALLRDEYPPFSWEPGDYPLTLEIPRAERQSRFRLFTRWLALVPNQIAFYFVLIAWAFTTFIAFFMILVGGKYPRGLFKFAAGVLRWQVRLLSYQYLLRDEYPPYSVNADARPGHEAMSLLISIPLVAAYVGSFVAIAMFAGGTKSTVHVERQLLTNGRLAEERPSATGAGLQFELVRFTENASSDGMVKLSPVERAVAFEIVIRRALLSSANFDAGKLWVRDCRGGYHRLANVSGLDTSRFDSGLNTTITAYFALPGVTAVCELQYRASSTTVRFVFDS